MEVTYKVWGFHFIPSFQFGLLLRGLRSRGLSFPLLVLALPLAFFCLGSRLSAFLHLEQSKESYVFFPQLTVTASWREPSALPLHWLSLYLCLFSEDILLEAAAAETLRCSPTGHMESPRQHPATPWPTLEAVTWHKNNKNWLQFFSFYFIFLVSNCLGIHSEKYLSYSKVLLI